MRKLKNNLIAYHYQRGIFQVLLWASALALTIWWGAARSQPHRLPPSPPPASVSLEKDSSATADSSPQVIGLLNQAQTALLEGNLKQAGDFLQRARAAAESFPELQPLVEGVAGSLALQQGNYTQAISSYQTALQGLTAPPSKLVALNNLTQAYQRRSQLARYQARGDLDRREQLWQQAEADEQEALRTAQLARQIPGDVLGVLRARVNEALLQGRAGHSLMEDLLALPPTPAQLDLLLAVAPVAPDSQRLWQAAVEESIQLGDRSRLDWSYGQWGRAEAARGERESALAHTLEAQWLAQAASDWEGLFQWQAQAGDIYQQLGGRERALAAYQASLQTMQSIRQILVGNRHKQWELQEKFQHVYEATLSLLLEKGDAPSIQRAIDVLEQAQLSELEAYFGDNCRVAGRQERLPLSQTEAALVHFVPLPAAAYAILQFADGSYALKQLPVPPERLQETVWQWRQQLQDVLSNRHLQTGRQLYDWLLRPLEEEWERHHVRTLVFVGGGLLRNVNLAALWDGEQYLVQKYAVSQSLGLSFSPLFRQPPGRALVLGLSAAARPPLPNVGTEAKEIASLLGGQVFLDGQFPTLEAEQLSGYRLLHLATHGTFAGDLDRSFLQAGAGNLSLSQVEAVLRASGSRLEHLTLSACETASGNDLAVLGLAGLALRAGIPSVLGSLWLVGDRSAAELTVDFYRYWQQGATKAEALRQAQLEQVASGAHPHSWAGLTLVGNWL
jgi:CHAT domain-containing protein